MSLETLRQLGTFDVENYGDLLYPLVLRRLAKTPVQHYWLDTMAEIPAFRLMR